MSVESLKASGSRLLSLSPRLLRCCLAGLAADLFAFVPDALAFVRFRLANGANLRRKLADHLFISPLDHDMCLIGTRHRKTFGDFFVHFVGESDTQLKRVALDCAKISDPLNLELFLVA